LHKSRHLLDAAEEADSERAVFEVIG